MRNLWSLAPVKLLCVFAVAGIQEDSEESKGSASPEERQLPGGCPGVRSRYRCPPGDLKKSGLPGPNVPELSYPYI